MLRFLEQKLVLLDTVKSSESEIFRIGRVTVKNSTTKKIVRSLRHMKLRRNLKREKNGGGAY